jgi:hypothetical protein
MNYGFCEFIPLTLEQILLRVSQEDIFSMVLKPVEGEFFLSPLRKNDSSAGCYFERYNGKLYFVDFGFSNSPMDCFNFISAYYGTNFKETLELINKHFTLGLGYSSTNVKPVIAQNNIITKNKEKNTQIIFHPRNYIKEDGKYWSQYNIKKSQLIEDHVYAVRWYKLTKNQNSFTVRPRKPSYALFEFNPRVKIYCPTTVNYNNKWITNCNKNDIGNIRNISSRGTNLLITKSYKDCRVIRNLGKKDVIWFQNEGILPDIPIIISLSKRFENISIMFDNDDAGKKAVERVVAAFNSYNPNKAKGFITPHFNDPAEIQKNIGEKPLIEFFKKNNIL